MKNRDISLNDLKSIPDLLVSLMRHLSRYAIIFFIVLVGLVYAFILLQINSLSNSQPSSSQISSQAKNVTIPQINPVTIRQIQNLQDNSVSVQALFNQARTNPFQ